MKTFRKLTLALATIGLLGAVGWSITAHAAEDNKAAPAAAKDDASNKAADEGPSAR
jgi:hypothetical protein